MAPDKEHTHSCWLLIGPTPHTPPGCYLHNISFVVFLLVIYFGTIVMGSERCTFCTIRNRPILSWDPLKVLFLKNCIRVCYCCVWNYSVPRVWAELIKDTKKVHTCSFITSFKFHFLTAIGLHVFSKVHTCTVNFTYM